MKLVVEITNKGERHTGLVVGFTADEQSSYVIIVSGDRLVEGRIKDAKVISIEHIQATRMVSD